MAINFRRLIGQAFEHEPADDLAMFDDERHLAGADFQNGAGATAGAGFVPKAGVEEARIVDPKFAHQRIERHHLGGKIRRD